MTAEILQEWEHFFKPEVRSSGRLLFKNGKVNSSQPSDTEIQAYIKGSTSVKVSFKTKSMDSALITVDCSCPASKKGQLCKHIWATLLKVETNHPDFLDEKKEIQKRSSIDEDSELSKKSQANSQSSFRTQEKPMSQAQMDSQTAYKTKQADYRKQQYQKQKQRLKDQKQSKRKSKLQVQPDFPKEVEMALAYFDDNGFPMETPLDADSIRLAKKKLSRVFHPDIGGSHSEIVELNKHFEILMNFAET